MQKNLLCLLGCCFLILPQIQAQIALLNIKSTPTPIKLDGVLDEPIWDQVEPFPLTMHEPTYGGELSERSEIMMTHDNDYLYLGGRLYAEDASTIQATTKKRDAMTGNTDWFGLILDTYNDNENALAFFTTPTGMRSDMAIFNDAQGTMTNMPMNSSWNTYWDVEVNITEEGWFAEIRIPFSSLRFQDSEGEVTMGVIAWRWIPAHNETQVFPGIKPEWGPFSLWKPSQAQKIKLEGVYAKKPVYFSPYALGGLSQSYELNDEGANYQKVNDRVLEIGGDLKYNLTSNLTLDLTANTDFAQVEADDQQVNLTRFSLFFPEKRQFFQERSSIFEVGTGLQNRLFYSRRIGLDDNGNPVRIFGGARVSGRMGKWDVGMMNMQTASSNELNSENFSVARLRRQVINQYSYFGGIVTNRTDFKGNFNTTYGFDGTFRLFGNDYVQARFAQTRDSESPNELFSAQGSKIYVQWERRQTNKFHYDLSYARVGENFNPGMGFEARSNYTRYGGILGYGWLPGADSWIFRHRFFTDSYAIYGNTNNRLESAQGTIGYDIQTKKGFMFTPQFRWNHEFLEEELPFSDKINIQPGTYRFYDANIQFTTPFAKKFYVFSNIQVGGFYNGNIASVLLLPTWNANASLETSITYSMSRIALPGTDALEYIHVGGLKALYMLSTKLSVASQIQYNSLAKGTFANIRFRWNPREGNDLFIVYNDSWNAERMREIPHLPFSSQRTIVVKYTHTFRL